ELRIAKRWCLYSLFATRPSAGRPKTLSRPRREREKATLLELDLGADLLELGLDLLGLFLARAFLDRLRRAFDEVLGFLEAKAGDGADFLDDLNLLVSGGGQDDVELGLLLDRSGGGARSRRDGDRGGGRDAPLLFEELGELGGFQHGQRREVIDDLFEIGHCV